VHANQKIRIAEELGARAFTSGASAIPALDKALIALFEGLATGEAASIITAWQRGFINAPLPE
jgi:hypothetical protein